MFEARFIGNCGSCEGGIYPGDPLRFSEGKYIHADCLDIIPETPRRPGPVCSNCFIEKPCECDD